MKNNKLLIVEDEQIIAENLRFILNEYGYEFVDVAMDANEATQLFEQTKYDLVLMDINLGEASLVDGVDLIKLLEKKYTFEHLYVTANADDKTVQKAKSTSPSGYLVKPFMNSSIYANVEVALNKLKKDTFFSYPYKGMQQRINLSKVTTVQADGAYVYLNIHNEERHCVRKSLMEFYEQYPSIFVRIHKSTLVNKNHIQGYNSRFVKVGDENLPLGRTYKQFFLEEIEGKSFG